jgi:hypothetical protein
VAPARRDQLLQPLRLQHGAGRIGGAGHEKAGDALAECGLLDLPRGRHPARVVACLQQHSPLAECAQDVAVARIARRRQSDGGAGIEQSQKGQNEAGRRSRRDDDAVNGDVEAVALAIIKGNALAQLRHAERQGVAQSFRAERALDALECGLRRRRAGLAHFHVDNPRASRLLGGSRLHHVHDDERGDVAALRRPGEQRLRALWRPPLFVSHRLSPALSRARSGPQSATVRP